MDEFVSEVIPIAVAFFLVCFIIFVVKDSTRKDSHFDEMQLKIRATGYKIGFYVTLIGVFIFGYLFEVNPGFNKVLSPSFCMMAAGLVGIFSFAVYCIFKDAFYSIGQNRKVYIWICVLVIFTNSLGAIRHISDGTFIEDGIVSFSNCGGLLCATGFLVILISLIVKERVSKKEEDT